MNVLMGKVNRTGGTLFINGREAEMHTYKKIIGCEFGCGLRQDFRSF